MAEPAPAGGTPGRSRLRLADMLPSPLPTWPGEARPPLPDIHLARAARACHCRARAAWPRRVTRNSWDSLAMDTVNVPTA
eukprot:1701837-Pleurochrysis_carterae.AAC.1